MAISYYSLEIITDAVEYDILFSGVFGIDEGTNQIIKFYNNADINVNILDSDLNNANNANWLFNVNNKIFSENGTIVKSIPSLNAQNAMKFKIYTINDKDYIDYYDGIQWNTLPDTYRFIINFITTTQIMKPKLRIDRYCELQKKHGLSRMKGCFQALPISKKYLNNTMNNNVNNNDNVTINTSCNLRNKMKYAEYVRTYGGTVKSTSAFKIRCFVG